MSRRSSNVGVKLPESVEELCSLVHASKSCRVVGHRHSCSAVGAVAAASPSSVLISLERLPSVLDIDEHEQTVTCGPSVTCAELALYLRDAGYSLPTLPMPAGATLIGSLATARHGTGETGGTLLSALVSLEFVDADGALVCCTGAPRVAAIVGGYGADDSTQAILLGCLGVVTEVTLTVGKTYDVRADTYVGMPWTRLVESLYLEEVLGAAQTAVITTDNFMAGDFLPKRASATQPTTLAAAPTIEHAREQQQAARPPSPARTSTLSLRKKAIAGRLALRAMSPPRVDTVRSQAPADQPPAHALPNVCLYHALPPASTRVVIPAAAPTLLGATIEPSTPSDVGPWSDKLHKVPHVQETPPGRTPAATAAGVASPATSADAEPLRSDYFISREHGARAIGALCDIGAELHATSLMHVCTISTAPSDGYWLSPCYRRSSLVFSFGWRGTEAEVRAHALWLVEAALAPFGPRPGWSTLFGTSPTAIATAFPKIDAFRTIVGRIDPKGKFHNGFIRRFVIGAAGTPTGAAGEDAGPLPAFGSHSSYGGDPCAPGRSIAIEL